MLAAEIRTLLIVLEVELGFVDEFEGTCFGGFLSGLCLRHVAEAVRVAVPCQAHGICVVVQTAVVYVPKEVLCFRVHHWSHKGLVQCRMSESHANAVATTRLLVACYGAFDVLEATARIVLNLLVEGFAAVELEARQEYGETSHDTEHGPAVTVGFNEKSDYNIRQKHREDHAVEEDSPEKAARFGLGNKDVPI